jgi:hypothetical protein
MIASGAVSGLWTGRWSVGGSLTPQVARLSLVPLKIGDWQGRTLTLDPRMVTRAEIAGYLMRRYEDSKGGAVTVLLVAGRPGPIAVHTPEVCYGGAGYEPSAPKVSCLIDPDQASRPDRFWLADFIKSATTAPEHLRILYAWTADGSWTASGHPRLDFASVPALYKLYIVRETFTVDEPVENDPGIRFARQFLPAIRKAVFQTS